MAYDYPTNFSGGMNVTGPGSLFQYADYLLGGFFAMGVLIFIFAFTFVVGAVNGGKKALLFSSFITFMFAVYFLRLGMINSGVLLVLIIAMIVGAIGSKEER